MKLLVFITLFALCGGQEPLPERRPVKRSYVCPPKFVRQGHRCYFFSRKAATWQDAHFQCRDMRSNIAIVNNANQDKLIRTFLSKKTLAPLERWIGGVYDWGTMSWKWAASGRPLTYNGFQTTEKEDKENLRWHCIIMDPTLHYRWSSRSCVEQKHFICHTKIKIVGNRGKKKLQRQYNADKYNKLNEIPVPTIPDYNVSTTQLKTNVPISYKLEINQSLNDQALLGYAPMEQRRRGNRRKKKKGRLAHLKRHANGTIAEEAKRLSSRRSTNGTVLDNNPSSLRRYTNNTTLEVPRTNTRRNNNRRFRGKEINKDEILQHIKWKTYRKNIKTKNPLYPRPIVEEYKYVKHP